MTEKEIFIEFEKEKGFDPITTSDCELTNWLVKKLIEARNELNTLRLVAVSGLVCDYCNEEFEEGNGSLLKCGNCRENGC